MVENNIDYFIKRKIYLFDCFLIIFFFTLGLFLLFNQIGRQKLDDELLVYVVVIDGKTDSYPLDKNAEFEVNGFLGRTKIAIKDKKVKILNSPCKNHLCIAMGSISKNGETLICAPNGVVINIIGKNSRCPDAISN